MNADRVFDIFGAIVTVALVTTIVSHPATSSVISSVGNAFTNSIKAAQGR